MPTDGAPAATAAKAYSICTNFPEGLKNTLRDNCLMPNEDFFSYKKKCILWQEKVTVQWNDIAAL